jgi:hypothetical protein
MYDISEASMGLARIDALVARDQIAHDLGCPKCGRREETEFWLAALGWSGISFLREAWPEFYGGFDV